MATHSMVSLGGAPVILAIMLTGYGQAPLPDQLAASGISCGTTGGVKSLFLSHPPLEERIAALHQGPCTTRPAPLRTGPVSIEP